MSNTFRDELYPLIKAGLSRPVAQKEVTQSVSSYVDRNYKHLVSQGPSGRPTFTEADKEKLYGSVDVTKEQVTAIIKSNPLIKGQWRIMNDPFNSLAAVSVRYGTVEQKDELLNSLLLYLTLSMYPSLHFKYFRYEPNEQVMAYTIANMSNKFKIKQVNTVLQAMIETTMKCYELQKPGIARGSDKEIVDFVMDVKTRLNSLLKNIASEFYKNHQQNLYLNSDGDSYEEDNYHEADSNSYAVERITNNVVLKLTVQGPDTETIAMTAKMCQVSVNELRNYINSLVISENRDDIRKLVEAMLSNYLIDEQENIDGVSRNNKFLAHAMATYKKSNTSDKNIIKIKEVLDSWMEDIDIYKKTQRQATINNFRRAIYLFFAVSIMKMS